MENNGDTKRRILFVDDEPKVLDGLQRMLRKMRHEWDMSFAPSGQDALDILSKKPFDVVVSDMRMPVMDGNILLTEIRNLYPQIIRIILSGHADRDMILKSVEVAHQYLSKPCDAETLKSTVIRSCALRNILNDEILKGLVSDTEKLPSLPVIYNQVLKEVQSQNASIKKIGMMIAQDIGMTAKILKMVNSAFFGLCRHITNPEQAVVFLGLDTVRALVLSIQVFSTFDQSQLNKFSIEDLWNHSSAVGSFARLIALEESCGQKTVDNIFMAGLLHDIGKLVLAANLPEKYGRVMRLVQDKGIAFWEAEREIFGATHAEVGAYLLSIWGIPDSIVETLAFHHCPEKCLSKTELSMIAVYVADAMEHKGFSEDAENTDIDINTDYIKETGFFDRIAVWQKRCQTAVP